MRCIYFMISFAAASSCIGRVAWAATMDENARPSLAVVDTFDVNSARALEAFGKIAREYHVVIGVSGTILGSDDKLISLKLSHTTVSSVLDAIVTSDPRYSWQEKQDGSVSVNVGHLLTATDVKRADLANELRGVFEVDRWLENHSCELSEILLNSSSKGEWNMDISASDDTIQHILNRIVKEKGTYAWTLIKFSEAPCSINLSP